MGIFGNINLWLGALALAREIVKLMRERHDCTRDGVEEVKQTIKIVKNLKEKNKKQ